MKLWKNEPLWYLWQDKFNPNNFDLMCKKIWPIREVVLSCRTSQRPNSLCNLRLSWRKSSSAVFRTVTEYPRSCKNIALKVFLHFFCTLDQLTWVMVHRHSTGMTIADFSSRPSMLLTYFADNIHNTAHYKSYVCKIIEEELHTKSLCYKAKAQTHFGKPSVLVCYLSRSHFKRLFWIFTNGN